VSQNLASEMTADNVGYQAAKCLEESGISCEVFIGMTNVSKCRRLG